MMGSIVVSPAQALAQGSDSVWALLAVIGDPAKSKAALTELTEAQAKLEKTREMVAAEQKELVAAKAAHQVEHTAAVVKLEEDRKAHAGAVTTHARAVDKFKTEQETARSVAASEELKAKHLLQTIRQERNALDQAVAQHTTAVAGMTARDRAAKAREDAVKAAEEAVAAMKADYEKKLAALRAFHDTVAA